MASVQYIAYQIKTAAEGDLTRANYPGLSSDESDIKARSKILLDAIEAAHKSHLINSTATKIFMAPEFYFRGGKAGAYEVENISKINEFFDEYLADKKYEKWVFVLGTTIGRMPVSGGTQEVLNIAIVRKGGIKVTTTGLAAKDSVLVYKEYVSHIDYLGPFFGNYVEFRTNPINAGKANVGGQLATLVPTSGSNPTEEIKSPAAPNRVRDVKTWKPSFKLQVEVNAKFVKKAITKQERDRILAPVDYTISEQSASGIGGGVRFDMSGLKFGLEVCLDHGKSRLIGAFGGNPTDLDVHLICSCGMPAEYGLVKTGGYLFRCDGIGSSANEVQALRWTGIAWEAVATAGTIDMTESKRWIRHPAKATNLFQGERGRVYIYKPGTLP